MKQALLLIGCLFLSVMLMALSILVPPATFNTPDETANFFFTKVYSDNGEFYYEAPELTGDIYNMNHIRGVITYEGRGVPYAIFGLPLMYGTFYSILGQYTFLIGIILALIGIFFVCKLLYSIGQISFAFSLIGVMTVTSHIYWGSQPYMNTIPSASFFIVAMYFLSCYIRMKKATQLYLTTIFFAIASLIRIEFVIFAFFLGVLTLTFYWSSFKLRDVGLSLLLFMLVLIIPILILNTVTYGSPLTFSYSVFTHVNFPERVASSSSVFGIVSKALMPEEFRGYLLLLNLQKLTFPIMPLLFLISLPGILLLFKSKETRVVFVGYSVMVLYILLYGGSGLTWGYDQIASLRNSTVRYWSLVYIALLIPASYFLVYLWKNMNKKIVFLFMLTTVVLLPLSLFDTDPSSLTREAQTMNLHARQATAISNVLPEKSVVFTNQWDKFLYPANVTVATWWFEQNYEPLKIKYTMQLWLDRGYRVYWLDEQSSAKRAAIEKSFNYQYRFKPLSGSEVYELVSNNDVREIN